MKFSSVISYTVNVKTSAASQNIILFLLFSTLLFSCTDKPVPPIGLDLLGVDLPFVGFDTTLAVMAYSQIEDSVISDELTYNQLGSMYTPVFGLTNASLYMHLRLATLNPDFGDPGNRIIDSTIFSLVYQGAYGNLNTQLRFKIFPVTQDFFRDSVYYSNGHFSYSNDSTFADYSFLPDLSDQMVIDNTGDNPDTSYVTAALRIPFDDLFAETIFNLDPDYFTSNDKFIEGLKGIYILPDDVNMMGEGAILSFNLLDLRSGLTIYYKPHPDSSQRTYRFIINSNNARVGSYAHHYSLSTDQTFKNMVFGGDTTLGTERLYLQGLGGVKTVIKIPGLADLANTGNIIINEAKLVFNVENYPEAFPPPERLLLFKLDDQQRTQFLPDQAQGEGFFGGIFGKSAGTYWFRITLHSQDLVDGAPDYGIVLFPTGKSIRPEEGVFYGTNPSIPGHLKLEVIYTRIE